MTSASLLGDSQAGGIKEVLGEQLRALGWTTLAATHDNGASTRVLIDGGALALALARRPDVLVVFAGGNDTPTSSAHWGELVDVARAAGARVVWVGPPGAVGDATLDARRLAISRAQQTFFSTKAGVKWLDGRQTAQGLPRRDEVHLTIPAGYREWAARLAPAIVGPASSGLAALAGAALVLGGAWWFANRAAR
jgi:lysophospholipase L1-like esterase